ncbi:mechanosensitive ion channel family protein [Galbibacter pacificus]|uniref:Mechanosensitive ion channel n=1 Tax=Galbibacter pacificus TaxID=2996052 RepID=A0ABT6FNX0_9FLAO|nr:mechanosensitive ion channel domain-containing protein [Galbibacter pacificus]MDG3581475.1 mechanosensitive ion channel [Galbibacter pacificus]MDG3584953.1 mechanosensitive ion channel [Galbibacter pacificus]
MKEIINDIIKGISNFFSYPIFEGTKSTITAGTLLMIILCCIASFYVLKLIRRLMTSKLPLDDRLKFKGIFKFANYFIYLIIIIIVLSSSGVDLTVLLTASAALFVGLGFALQYLFQDIISGVLIIIDQSLHVGDIIEIEGKVGRVINIKLRTTRAITRDDKIIIIPNHKFLTDIIYNYTQNHRTTRETVTVGVAYGSDTRLVEKLLLDAVDVQKGVLKNPKPTVNFKNFGDSALIFDVNFFINDSFSDPRIKSAVRFTIDDLFRKHKVSIPFPQRDVHIFNK